MDKDEKLIIGIIVSAVSLVIVAFVAIALFGFWTNRNVSTPITNPPKQRVAVKCVIGGCSKQLCVEEGQDLASTCEYTDEYACYSQSFAKCEVQSDGKCGWTQNEDMKQCINSARSSVNIPKS